MNEDSIQLRDQVGVLRRRWLVVATTLLLAVGLGLMFYLLQTPVYVANTEVLLAEQSDGTPLTAEQIATEAKAVELNADEVIDEAGLDESASDLLETVTVTPAESGASIITISVSRSNADEAARITNGLASAYLSGSDERNEERVAQLDEEIENLELEISQLDTEIRNSPSGAERISAQSRRRNLEAERTLLVDARASLVVNSTSGGGTQFQRAETPDEPTSPDLVRDLGLAVALGLFIGIGLAYLREHFDDVIREDSDLGEGLNGLPVLARIPRWSNRSGEPTTLTSPRGPASEAYRELAANTRSLLLGRTVSPVAKAGGKVLLVTSAVSSEGKSVTAINLAVVAASMNQRVLLVDANLRRPDMHSILNLSVDGGLVDVLRGHRSAPSAIVGVGIEHLHVLAAGEVPVDPAELLTSPRMLSLIGELRGAYDLVVIDTAATLPVADTLEFVGDADAAVFVVRAGVSRTRDVSEAISRVDRAGGSTAGIVLNEVTSRVKRSDRAYYASTSVNGRRKKSQGGPEQHGVSEGNQIVPGFASDPPEDPEEPATRSA